MSRWWGFLRSLVIYHNPKRQHSWKVFYKTILKPQDLVFDVGAHVGTRARAMRKAGANVIALEPQSPFTRFLRLTLPSDITLIDAAVGGSETKAEMSVSSKHPTVSSLRTDFVSDAATTPGFEHVRWDSKQTVQVVTLDGLIRNHGLPRYIKIDVEGFELEVLSGLSQAVALLSVEYLPGFIQLTHKVLDRIEQLGEYSFNPVAGEKASFLWEQWQDGKAVRQWLNSLPKDSPSGDLFAKLTLAK